MSGPRRLQPWQKLLLLALLVLAGLGASSWLFGEDVRHPKKLVARLEELIGHLGALAPVAFVAIQSIGPFLLLPAIPMAIAAGALFGPVWGAVWALAGNVIGAMLSFLAGRMLGPEVPEVLPATQYVPSIRLGGTESGNPDARRAMHLRGRSS